MQVSTNNQQTQQIDKEIREAFKDAVMLIGVEATKIISMPRQWQGFLETRDIVDKGQLRASQQIVFTSDTEAEIRYPVSYAAPVHNGATIRYRNGNTRRIPGRPWLAMAIKEKPIDETMGKLLRS